MQDFDGNTPLHTAVEANQKLSLEFLLVHDANPTIQNHRHMAPIHLAVDLNNTHMLEVDMRWDVLIILHVGVGAHIDYVDPSSLIQVI